MAHEVFISHSSQDKTIADAVCAALENSAIRCWIAPRDVQPGRSFAAEITRAIQDSKVMVLIFSAHSNSSEQVLREVQLAANAHLHIVQFRIENVLPNEDLEYYLSTPHWLDALTPPLESNLQRLGTSVKALLEMAVEEPAKRAVTPVAPSVDLTAARSQPDRVATTNNPGAQVKSTEATQSHPAIAQVASIFGSAGSKEPAVWTRKRLIMVTGSGAGVLLLFTLTVLLTRSHRSTDSSAEKDYAEAMKLAAGFGGTKINVPKAVECLQRAAAKNLPQAEERLGDWINNGLGGLAKDNVKADQWAKKALADGLTTKAKSKVEAQTELAMLYEYGLGVSKDETKAAELAQEAADHGYARAQNGLGVLYYNGQGVPKSLHKAAELYQKSANQGDADAQNNLGLLYQYGQGVPKDLGKAVQFYQKAADQGNAVAQCRLGFLYQYGQGVTKDFGKAAELYQKATDQGNAYSQNSLGWLYQYGQGVPKDLGKAVELYQKATDQGNAYSQNSLGWLYQYGQGVPKDLGKAVELYQKATDQGNAAAENNLGWLYCNGQGVTKDFGKAADLYQKAADQGNVQATNNLGLLYENGEGVPKDFGKAAELYQKAANQGYVLAQMHLGWLYQNGQGVTEDFGKAAELYQKAADQGNAHAQNNLGWLYESGQGVTKDLAKATELYQKAASQGNQTAIANLKSISGH